MRKWPALQKRLSEYSTMLIELVMKKHITNGLEVKKMHSEHHWLDEIFLKDLMFNDFKGKSWSDALDERDLENAKAEYEVNYSDEDYYFVVNDGSYEAAKNFIHCWIDAYYADNGFDDGLLTFEIMRWGDDGPNTICYEVEIKRNGKAYQTLYITLSRRDDGEWGIFEVQASELK